MLCPKDSRILDFCYYCCRRLAQRALKLVILIDVCHRHPCPTVGTATCAVLIASSTSLATTSPSSTPSRTHLLACLDAVILRARYNKGDCTVNLLWPPAMFSSFPLFISAMLTASATLSTVMAQSSSLTTTATVSATGTLTSTASTALMTLECWVMTTVGNQPASIPVQPTDAVASRAECWEVFPNSSGATLSIPYTNTDPNFEPTADWSSNSAAPTAAASDNISTTSASHKALKVLLPALICSIVGALLLIGFTVYYIRRRAHKQSMSSRARQWAHRHSASWQLKDAGQKSAEDGTGATDYAPTAGV